MSETTKLMNFEEFRAAASEPFGEAVRQQREFFRDDDAAGKLLQPNAISMGTWRQWDDGYAFIPVAG